MNKRSIWSQRSKRSLRARTTLTSKLFASLRAYSFQPWNKSKKSFVCLSLLVLISLPIESAPNRARKILTGEEAQQFDSWLKTKDGTEYGFGVSSQGDLNKLVWIVIASAVSWVGLLGFKIYDRFTGKSDQLVKDSKESRENWIRVASDIAYMKQHMVTESEVKSLIRDEITYLRDHKL